MSGPLFTERHVVAVNYDGWRLDRFLADQLKRATRAKVARIIKAGVAIERDGASPKVKSGTIVRTGDVVVITRPERADPATPDLDSIRVLFEEDSLVVLDKPPGTLVHRTAYEATRTVEAFLSARYPGERVEPVHRIDRDTSGVLLCGRGLPAVRALVAQFESAEPAKTYRALVSDPGGDWSPGLVRTFDTPLGFDAQSGVKIRVGAGDWACATHATCLRRPVKDVAELEVRIERGRQHQIRAHLSLFGTPIVGDKLYGMGDAFFLEWVDDPGAPALADRLPTRWHCLHAWRMELEFDGVRQVFEAPLPAHWIL